MVERDYSMDRSGFIEGNPGSQEGMVDDTPYDVLSSLGREGDGSIMQGKTRNKNFLSG